MIRSRFPDDNFPALDVCWLRAPAENGRAFLQTFSEVSVAIQAALREHLPGLFFKDTKCFFDYEVAWAVLVYQASRPYRGKLRNDLTYDVLNPAAMAVLFRHTKSSFVAILGQVEARLRAEGRPELAARYHPRDAAGTLVAVQRLRRSHRCLYGLIRNEGVLVEALVQLGGLQTLAPKQRSLRVLEFARRWSFLLRRFFPGTDCSCLAPVLLDAATGALQFVQQLRSESLRSSLFDKSDFA